MLERQLLLMDYTFGKSFTINFFQKNIGKKPQESLGTVV